MSITLFFAKIFCEIINSVLIEIFQAHFSECSQNVMCTNCDNSILLRTSRILHDLFESNLRNVVNVFKVSVGSLIADFLQIFKKLQSV